MAACTISGDGGPCGSCKRIEEIDALFVDSEVEQNFVPLEAARVALKIARNASHDLLVASLPLEIVSRIFQIYVDAKYNDDDDDDDERDVSPFLVHRMEDAPLRLGAVCRTWRAIAWTSPRLWIKMSVVLSGAGESTLELATQWLGRTGQLPLTICLYDCYRDGLAHLNDSDTGIIISLLRTICKFSSRWRTLDVSLHIDRPILAMDDNTIQIWSSDTDERDSNLQHLRLESLSPNLTAQLFKNLNQKPSPTYVALSNMKLGYLNIDWSNATTIRAEWLTMQESIQLFQASINLRTFNLEIMTVPMQSLSSPIIIPMLRALCLSHPSTSTILDCLTLPLLEELQWPSDNGTVDSIISLVGRSHCQLASLGVWNPKITDEFLLFLQATPSLRSLSITIDDDRGDGNAERLFKYLANSDGLADLPNLETLQFTIEPPRTLAWETIPGIFDPSRSHNSHSSTSAGPRLQRRSLSLLLDITGGLNEIGHIDMISLHRISELRRLGIDISILFREGYFRDEPRDLIATSMKFHCPNKSSTGYESD